MPGLVSGGISVVCGDDRSQLVGQARLAARSGDAVGLGRIFEAGSEPLWRRQRATVLEPGPCGTVNPLASIVRVSYLGVPIAEGVVLDLGLRVLLPFAGGALDSGGFAASAYVALAAADPALTALVIVCQPKLSELERRAVDRIPREMREMDRNPLDAGIGVERLIELRKELLLSGREP